MKFPKWLHENLRIIIPFTVFVAFLAAIYWATIANKQRGVAVYAWTGRSGFPGEIVFTANNHWGGINATFHDVGFNGKLDMVLVGEKIFDPNSPDWELWIERYRHVRRKATTGEAL